MVEQQADPEDARRAPAVADLGTIFHALSDGHRRSMLEALRGRPHSVGELAAPLPITLAAASKHVQVLEAAGLVVKARDGRRRVCRLDPAPLAAADAYLERYRRFWNNRLDDLERALRAEGADR
jgi:DNA-binding transcriptional ArsR family regulator